jgi:hypothetical protein
MSRAAEWLAFAAARGARELGAADLAGVAAGGTTLLVLYRMIREPGLDAATTVQLGPPLSLALLGVVALATVVAARAEDGRRERARCEAAQPRPAT